MIEDFLTNNEVWLLEKLLHQASSVSYNEVKFVIDDVNKRFEINDLTIVYNFIKIRLPSVYDYIESKGIYGYKFD